MNDPWHGRDGQLDDNGSESGEPHPVQLWDAVRGRRVVLDLEYGDTQRLPGLRSARGLLLPVGTGWAMGPLVSHTLVNEVVKVAEWSSEHSALSYPGLTTLSADDDYIIYIGSRHEVAIFFAKEPENIRKGGFYLICYGTGGALTAKARK